MKEFLINGNDSGQRLDRFVAKTVPLLPSSLMQKYIRLKRIKVCGKGAKRDTRLNTGDTVQMYVNDEFFETPSEENAYLAVSSPNLKIVYEDDNILLLDKLPGVLCHSDGGWSYDTLIARVQAYLYQKGEWHPKEENSFTPALCNRIDRNTGGIVIAAKNAAALRIMNQKIRDREIDKYYLCVVVGTPSPKAGRLKHFLFKDASKNQVFVSKKSTVGSKTAETEYETLTTSNGLSLVRCRLLTGRTHQIRAQMAANGTPLLGDGKYGREKVNRKFSESGQNLYSYKLTFCFSTDGELLEYLKGKTFFADDVPFVNKYFNGYKYY